MTIHDRHLKEAFVEWVKVSSQITGVVTELENEIERMRERKVADNIISQKDEMVERIINFFNVTDQLITSYRVGMANKQAEVMIMEDALNYALRQEWRERIFKRLAEDVNLIKERKQLKDELINKLNG